MSAAMENVELQQAAVKQHCKVLRMPTVSTQFSTMAEQAVRARQTHVGYLEALLAAETGRAREEHGGAAHPRGSFTKDQDPGRVRLLAGSEDLCRPDARPGRRRLHRPR